jgi:hypothetical protein
LHCVSQKWKKAEEKVVSAAESCYAYGISYTITVRTGSLHRPMQPRMRLAQFMETGYTFDWVLYTGCHAHSVSAATIVGSKVFY